jgi:DNA-binding MarR family transcriptional regulator
MADPSREVELNQALALMHFGFRKMIEKPDQLLAKQGFGRVHHRLLFFVARRPNLSVGDLLAILDITKQALHRPMQDLIRAEFLRASPDVKNRRVKRLFLTPAGKAYEDRLSGMQRALFARVFSGEGPAAERGFRAVMHALGEGRAADVLDGRTTKNAAGTARGV